MFRESLQAALSCGDVAGIATAVEGLAAASNDGGEPQRAAQLYASASAYRESTGSALAGVEKAEVEEGLGAVQGALTQAEFDAAWATGLLLTPENFV